MKYLRIMKLLGLLFFILSGSSFSQSEWKYQNPLPTGAPLQRIFPLSEKKVIISGLGGTIMTSHDGGEKWHVQNLPSVNWARVSSFISENEGWLISGGSLMYFKTKNGGYDWEKEVFDIDMPAGYYLTCIEFINSQKGYLIANLFTTSIEESKAYPSIIYKTEDGGINWSAYESDIPLWKNQILFINENMGFILTQPYFSNFDFNESHLYRTIDGGNSWEKLPGEDYGRIHFINNKTGWAGNYRTTDAGNSWHYFNFNFPDLSDNINKICFADSLTGYAITTYEILKTDDAGESWYVQYEPSTGVLQDIKFFTKDIGWVCGYGGVVFVTKDGGKTWKRFGEGCTENFYDVDFVNSKTGWTVGSNTAILHTRNGGADWERQSTPLDNNGEEITFRAVDFIDEWNGWIVGKGYILHTSNGGQNWEIQNQQDLADGQFIDVKFINKNIGFAIGTGGYVPLPGGVFFRTQNGGKTWQKLSGGSFPAFYSMCFIDDKHGWVCGGGGLIWNTTDSGNNWHNQSISGPYYFKSIQFIDKNYGWVSSVSSGMPAFFHTEDGGENWREIPWKNYRFLYEMGQFHFFNKDEGIASQAFGSGIAKTSDGGQNWEFLGILPSLDINSMSFINPDIGWVVGSAGAILKYGENAIDDTIDILRDSIRYVGNFPNPFNDKTTIFCILSKQQKLEIDIFNILGKKIETIFKGYAYEGYNEFTYNPNYLASGAYLIRFSCEDYIRTSRCILIK